MSTAVPKQTACPTNYRLPWQVSLRSMVVLTAMAALTLAWWRTVGHTYYLQLPAFWQWQSWFTIGTIACPFLVPLAGRRIQAHWHVGYLVKVWVLVCGANAIWGFVLSFDVSVEGPDPMRSFAILLNELIAAEFWTAFALPASLAIVASAAIPQPQPRAMIWNYGLILVVAIDLVLLSRWTPLVFANNWNV